MFCPKCKFEYREGYTKCADCDVDLVEEQPVDKYEYVEFTPIAETNNIGLIALAKSILDSEGIKYYVSSLQGYIPGCALLVAISDAADAKELLKDIGL